jgi:hypothetical protein
VVFKDEELIASPVVLMHFNGHKHNYQQSDEIPTESKLIQSGQQEIRFKPQIAPKISVE